MRSREDPTHVVLAAAAIALAGASGYFYLGPYAWLAELQLALFHAYVVQLTFIVSVIVCWLPLGLAHRVWSSREIQAGEPGAKEAVASPWNARWVALSEAAEVSPRASQVAMLGVALLAVGAWLGVDGLTAGTLREVDVSSLEEGEAPASRHVDLVGGSFLADRASAFRSGGLRFYVPYVSREGAATVFVEVGEHDRERVLTGPLRGVLEANGLPGPVRVDLEAQGEIADSHWMLKYGDDPAEQRTWAAGTGGLGVLLLAIGAFVMFRGRRQADVAHDA